MNRILFAVIVLSICACAPHKVSVPEATVKNADVMANMTSTEIMAKVKEAATPGQAHANLQPLVGKWVTETKIWMDPNRAPEVSKGRANHEWMLGKRFIKEDYSGKFGGQAFQGVGTIGFDNVKQEYVSTWVDTMGTGIMTSEGKFDPATHSIEMNGKYSCPMMGEKEARTVTKILSNNTHVFEMYDRTPDGKEFKTLEITYKRTA